MKLIVAVVNDQIASGLIEKLTERDFRVTKISSSGGWLQKGNTTIISGVDDDEEKIVLQIIKEYTQKKTLQQIEEGSSRKKLEEGMATVFVLPVEKMFHF
ncbi:cyclic-di-AMP receptor [Thermosyntropha sp.]|uniref:cyclic-di-AMP receptor n=1 Tax=Thermosyntropha sp. TaxID=2740820 RepID=UPI0025CD7A65|nr:cyclic-di-AMP receptor [Thermosyntropha sp.]MBO8158171.1 cyclic-di-AMP receptor [Thermosyntropha sp.]